MAIGEIYGRMASTARIAPWLLVLPFAAELLQHVVEIRFGMYVGGRLPPDAERVRLMFGAVKIIAIFVTLILALRWWRFDGDSRRAARPTLALLKGIGIVLLVELGAELLLLGLGFAAGQAAASAGRRARIFATIGPFMIWLFFAILLYPWYVGLLTEDRTMTLRRSIRGIWGRLWGTSALVAAGIFPAIALHYALGYGAMGRPTPLVWAMMAVDAVLVALLALLIASSYFTVYRRAAEVPA